MFDLHIEIPDYQKEYIDQHYISVSDLIRDDLDDFMIEEGADPEEWEETYGR